MQDLSVVHCVGGKDPKALETLVAAMNASGESVNRDLMTYKVLSLLPFLYIATIPSSNS